VSNEDKATEESAAAIPHSIPSAPSSGNRQRHGVHHANPTAQQPEAWTPPDFGNQRRTRIGASLVDEFVAGHKASDVLRELVQNEFDGGGSRLVITFADKELAVEGNGRSISSAGWKRLSVIVGTGRVVGEGGGERVAPKTNGIGSKNFGLRSLFLFGDQIYVRSGGHVAILDLPTLETGRIRDTEWWGTDGVRLRVPYRTHTFEKLEPFTGNEEERIFHMMASGVLATLVKLAQAAPKRGLQELILSSVRGNRTLRWRQRAKAQPCNARGVFALRRLGRLDDFQHSASTSQTFEELEFTRSLKLSPEYLTRAFPSYYRKTKDTFAISVSLPIARGRIDFARSGHFYYPLQAPDAKTGSTLSVSAPFDVDSDRSSLLDNGWNRWLIEQLGALVFHLLKTDWFDRFGADAFRAAITKYPASPTEFSDAITRRFSEEVCWPTRAKNSKERFAKASNLVLPESPQLDGFMSEYRYLAPTLQANEEVKALASKAGASLFTLSSLIRLRCAPENRKGLSTKINAGESDYHFKDYADALSDPERQSKMGAALTALSRNLSNANRTDLRASPSTLSATCELRPAKDLIRVDPGIWEVCPEPLNNRLHPALTHIRVIAGLCQQFDEREWMIAAAARAQEGSIDKSERDALWKKLLTDGANLSRRVLSALWESPVLLDQHSRWVAPSKMVFLTGPQAKFVSQVLSTPNTALTERPSLLAKLKIRNHLKGEDIVRSAAAVSSRPQLANEFETLLNDHQRLLTSGVVEELSDIAFIRARSGKLSKPSELFLDTTLNRQCLGHDRLVRGNNIAVYRRLQIREQPSAESLLSVLHESRELKQAPPQPTALYPALAAALRREKTKSAEFAKQSILWVESDYFSPNEVLVGAHVPRLFDVAVPVLRRLDELGAAFHHLGASKEPEENHWRRFFEHVSGVWENARAVDARLRHNLIEAYHLRGRDGLPEGLDEDAHCLLDRNGRLFSLADVRDNQFVEADFPDLADALLESGSAIGIINLTAKNREFFSSIGISSLTALAGPGTPIFGTPIEGSGSLKANYRDTLLRKIQRELFMKASYELAAGQRRAAGFHPIRYRDFQRVMGDIKAIEFYESISKRYEVDGVRVSIPVEVAISDRKIGLAKPRAKLDCFQLIAQAVAELVGAQDVAQMRTLSAAFLPLFLYPNPDELHVYLERMGVDSRIWEEDGDLVESEEDLEGRKEEILRQVFDNLIVVNDAEPEVGRRSIRMPDASTATSPKEIARSYRQSAEFNLPDIDAVTLSLADLNDRPVHPRGAQRNGSGDTRREWAPRDAVAVERDQVVGSRGEELVYRMELERIRSMGHERPEEFVTWTSRYDPGADHDIKSIGSDGKTCWIEVKSTTGKDGRFEWSRKEFEKAVREGAAYQLWRVYDAASVSPVAKCFVNPAGLIGESKMILELGSLRASIEGLDGPQTEGEA